MKNLTLLTLIVLSLAVSGCATVKEIKNTVLESDTWKKVNTPVVECWDDQWNRPVHGEACGHVKYE